MKTDISDKIKLPALKKILVELKADEATSQLVINTAKLYNHLVDKLNKGEKVHPYMLTGTNGQIFNQLLSLKKLNQKAPKEDDDPFNEFVSTFKNKKIEVRG